MNEYQEYSIRVKAQAQEFYLKAFRKLVNQPNDKISIEAINEIEKAFKPVLNELVFEIEQREKDIENLKKQIR